MTRQAFLAQMPVPPPPLAPRSVSPISSPGNLLLSLFLFIVSASFSRSLDSGPLSPPSHQKSRAIALGGLSTLLPTLRSHIAGETCTRSTACSGPSRRRRQRRANRKQSFMPLYAHSRAHIYTRENAWEAVRRNRWCVCVPREPEKERGNEAVPCLALPSICSSQVARTLDIETLQ